MKLHVLFIQRKESYPGQYAPEARIVWDEYSRDENPEGFDEAVEKDLAEVGRSSIIGHKVIAVEVPQDEIRSKILDTPVVEGQIVGDA